MELYDIVDSVSSLLKEGHLVINKSMKVHSKFAVYKVFVYTLYCVNNNTNTVLLNKEYMYNTPSEELNIKWKETDKKFLKELLIFLLSNKFKEQLKDGI